MTEPKQPKWLKFTKASAFPAGWCPVTDKLVARVATDFKRLRPNVVDVFVAHRRGRMVVQIFVLPRPTAEVLKRVKAIAREFAALAAATPRKTVAEVASTAIQDGRESAISAADDHVVREAECRQRLLDADASASASAAAGAGGGADEFDLAPADTQASPVKLVQVFSPLQARELLANLGLIGDSDSRARVKQALARVVRSGGRRQVIQPPNLESEPVRRLQEDFPNFRRVLTQAVLPHIALTLANVNPRLVPLLLVGPPGVGKSMFACALAEVLAKRDGVDAPSSVTIERNTSRERPRA